MNLGRKKEIKSLKNDIDFFESQVSDTIFSLVGLNLLGFFSLATVVFIATIMFYDKLFLPILILGITESLLLTIIYFIKKSIKKDIPYLLKDEEDAKRSLDDYKNGINRKVKKSSKSLTDKQIESYIDVKSINAIYNEIQREKVLEIRNQKANNRRIKDVKQVIKKDVSKTDIKESRRIITNEMVMDINKLFMDEPKKEVTFDREITQDMVDQINELFNNDNPIRSKHNIEIENSVFVKKMGVRR